MATVYAQTVFDIGLGAYVRYTQQLVTANPDPATTTPVGVGPFNAATHRILQQIESHNPQTWLPVATFADLPSNSAVLVGDTCYVIADAETYRWDGAVWAVLGGGGVPSPVKITGAIQQTVTISGVETLVGSFGAFDPGTFSSPTINFEVAYVFAPATAGTVAIRLYDVGTRATPTAGTLRSTITATVADAGVRKCVSNTLLAVAVPGVNTNEIASAERLYEIRVEMLGTNPGDVILVDNASVIVYGTVLGGVMAPATAGFLTLAATSGLSQERVFTPANSLRAVDGGANSTYTVDLVGDVPAPGPSMSYETDGAGVRGWYPRTAMGPMWEWNQLDLTQFAVDNPLPAPGLAGATVGGAMSLVSPDNMAPPNSVSMLLTMTSAATDHAVWWVDDIVPLQNSRFELAFGLPFVSGPPVVREAAVGFAYAGDIAGYYIADMYVFLDDGLGGITVKHRVLQVDTVGTTVLCEDDVPGGFFWTVASSVVADRLDPSIPGPPGSGLPRGVITSTATAFASPPTTGLTFPHGISYVLNSGFLPPADPAGWNTSACNRVGLVFGGTLPGGPNSPVTVNITRFRIFGE